MGKFFLNLTMHKRLRVTGLFLLFHLFCFSQKEDTIVRGVKIDFNYSLSIFPAEWQASPVNAHGEAMDRREIQRAKMVMNRALSKYPQDMLEKNLRSIHFLGMMKFFDVPYGGTNSNSAIYLVNNGKALGYTSRYLEQTFHHEFSSILLRNYSQYIDTNAWKSNNATGFTYNDPENGVGAIRNNESSQDLDSFICEKGLLTQYATSSIENDFNTFAQNLFLPERDFWKYVDQYPGIKNKVEIMISFYNRISPVFTETYFRNMRD